MPADLSANALCLRSKGSRSRNFTRSRKRDLKVRRRRHDDEGTTLASFDGLTRTCCHAVTPSSASPARHQRGLLLEPPSYIPPAPLPEGMGSLGIMVPLLLPELPEFPELPELPGAGVVPPELPGVPRSSGLLELPDGVLEG